MNASGSSREMGAYLRAEKLKGAKFWLNIIRKAWKNYLKINPMTNGLLLVPGSKCSSAEECLSPVALRSNGAAGYSAS